LRASVVRLVTAAIATVPAFLQRSEPASPSRTRPERVEGKAESEEYAASSVLAGRERGADVEPIMAPAAAFQEVPTISVEEDVTAAGQPETQPADRRRRCDRRELSLSAAADLCSRLARALDGRDVTALLADAARLLDAVGIVVWLWDSRVTALRASVGHGYPDAVLARMPAVRPDASNAIAAAYRSGEPCLVAGAEGETGAVVVPSLGPSGCVGVLALEIRHGGEHRESVRALATILAAQLGMFLPSPAES
jgi:hypothetical protein